MNIWLITWEWTGDHVKIEGPIIAIFSSRKSNSFIKEYVEHFYEMTVSPLSEIAYFANRKRKRPYKAKCDIINNIPHEFMITCGHNPHIYARQVSEFNIQIDETKEVEIIKWKEPPIFQNTGNQNSKPAIVGGGSISEMTRKYEPLLKIH